MRKQLLLRFLLLALLPLISFLKLRLEIRTELLRAKPLEEGRRTLRLWPPSLPPTNVVIYIRVMVRFAYVRMLRLRLY